MDESMENPRFEEDEELNEFMDDDQDEEVEEWLIAPVTPPRATVTVPITYEVGGPSTAIPVGNPLTTVVSGVAMQPQNQQLQTRLSMMENREGTLISYMSWMEERLVVLEKRLTRPPTEP
nr:hypothetical protein [Tanacetum cinerariifolium]